MTKSPVKQKYRSLRRNEITVCRPTVGQQSVEVSCSSLLPKKVNANLLHWGECIIWFKIPLITCTPLWFFHRLRQPVERGTVLVFLPGDYKLHMYFIVWTKQYSISKPKGCALPAHSVCLVMTNALTLAKEKNLCKTYLLRIVNFKDSEF